MFMDITDIDGVVGNYSYVHRCYVCFMIEQIYISVYLK